MEGGVSRSATPPERRRSAGAVLEGECRRQLKEMARVKEGVSAVKGGRLAACAEALAAAVRVINVGRH